MRLLLDTNVLVYFLYSDDDLSPSVKINLLDYSNALFTSTVCIHELIHLCQTGKIKQNADSVFLFVYKTVHIKTGIANTKYFIIELSS